MMASGEISVSGSGQTIIPLDWEPEGYSITIGGDALGGDSIDLYSNNDNGNWGLLITYETKNPRSILWTAVKRD